MLKVLSTTVVVSRLQCQSLSNPSRTSLAISPVAEDNFSSVKSYFEPRIDAFDFLPVFSESGKTNAAVDFSCCSVAVCDIENYALFAAGPSE